MTTTIRLIDFSRDLKPADLGDTNSRSSCNIVVEDGLFGKSDADQRIVTLLGKEPTSCVIITDSTVRRFYGLRITKVLSKITTKTDLISFPPGEGSKRLDRCTKILADLARLGFDRDGVLIMLGGGVVGDIGGFVASVYKRGVRYIQVPTTLLAQVDSSIGGKTGVDTEWGKNQIGTIYQPAAVLIDPCFLETLPSSEALNGLGEMVKYGVIANEKKIFASLERRTDFSSPKDFADLIKPCCRIKAEIVSMDEYDENIRSILNYGHTVAHALEASSDYQMNHGLAVLIGMLCEGWIGRELCIFQRSDFARQEALINRILPEKSACVFKKIRGEKIVQFALSDKKNSKGELRMSLPERIGRMHKTGEGSYKIPVPARLLKDSVNYAKQALSI